MYGVATGGARFGGPRRPRLPGVGIFLRPAPFHLDHTEDEAIWKNPPDPWGLAFFRRLGPNTGAPAPHNPNPTESEIKEKS